MWKVNFQHYNDSSINVILKEDGRRDGGTNCEVGHKKPLRSNFILKKTLNMILNLD